MHKSGSDRNSSTEKWHYEPAECAGLFKAGDADGRVLRVSKAAENEVFIITPRRWAKRRAVTTAKHVHSHTLNALGWDEFAIEPQ